MLVLVKFTTIFSDNNIGKDLNNGSSDILVYKKGKSMVIVGKKKRLWLLWEKAKTMDLILIAGTNLKLK